MVKHVLSEIPAKEYIISDERKAELDAMYSPEVEIARLQEQLRLVTAEREFWKVADRNSIDRAEAAEAERDRLRATVTRVTDLLDSYEDRFSPPHTIVEREIGILDTCANIRMAIAGTHDPAAFQKEPQP